jgi:hypothetical protein
MLSQTKDDTQNGKSVLLSTEAPLLTIETLAHLLCRTPAGIRTTLHGNTEFAERLRKARVRLGRRVYFRRDLVDRMIADATGQ